MSMLSQPRTTIKKKRSSSRSVASWYLRSFVVLILISLSALFVRNAIREFRFVLHEAELVVPMQQAKSMPAFVSVSNHNRQQQQIDDQNKDKDNSLLPDWFVEYTTWHRATKPQITQDNWHEHKYLVLHCLKSWPFCSGTSDRLRNFLFLIYLSQYGVTELKDRRIFLIHWERPAALEEFLVPTPDGINWTMPAWLLPRINESLHSDPWKGLPAWNEETLMQHINTTKREETVLEFSFTWQLQNLILQRWAPNYGACFRSVFQASPPVQQLIDQTKHQLGLSPLPPSSSSSDPDAGYTALHLRTKYTSVNEDERPIQRAIQCATWLASRTTGAAGRGGPNNNNNSSSSHTTGKIFVASDNVNVIQMSERLAKNNMAATLRNHNIEVVVRQDYDAYPPLHIDIGNDYLISTSQDWKNRPPSDFYGVFVDLLLLGGATCVVSGIGNYGLWARLLSKNYSCYANYISDNCPL